VAWGALAWAASVAVKIGVAALLNGPVLAALGHALPEAAYFVTGALYMGVLTGLTEVVFGYVLARRLQYSEYHQGTGYGLGFGAVEALLLGISVLSAGLTVALAPELIPEAARAELTAASWANAGVAPTERVLAIIAHIACGVLIVRSVALRRLGWFWVAFIYKSALDAVAGFEHVTQAVSEWPPWLLEAPFVPVALVGIWLIWDARRGWPAPIADEAAPPGAPAEGEGEASSDDEDRA
jgi:hypothetical protein